MQLCAEKSLRWSALVAYKEKKAFRIILLSLQFVQDNHYGGEWIPLLIKPQKHDRKDGLKNIGKIFFFPDIQTN